jgi:RIO-like serine/threonine protein kinase
MKLIINPKYKQLTDFINSIPNIFEIQGTSIYKARNELKTYETGGYDIVVKSFRKPHLLNRIAYGFLRPSKAQRSYKYALELLKRGVSTPEPIAYIEEKKGGLLNRSYYICIFEREYDHIRLYMTGEKKDDAFLAKLADFIADFHKKGVLFLDMSPGNILFKEANNNVTFSLVDINRTRFKTNLSKQERYQSFKRLSHNVSVINFVVREYALQSGINENEAITEVIKICKKFFKAKLN